MVIYLLEKNYIKHNFIYLLVSYEHLPKENQIKK